MYIYDAIFMELFTCKDQVICIHHLVRLYWLRERSTPTYVETFQFNEGRGTSFKVSNFDLGNDTFSVYQFE